ncbi:NSFL1 cofactor p47-like [Asterias amurensis]|uniref:NSFL1 cofactor p47-like n=1 Tax=Asterias amurensis TaxID=7602 RepID=UPI003AB20B28
MMADEAQKATSIADFAGVTGVDAARAKFYLESSGWQLQVALGSFYDNDSGDDVTFQDASDEPRPAVREPQEVVDLSGEDAVEGLGRIEGRGVGSRKPKTSSSSSARLHTINDFGKEAEAESDSGEEGETFYAGGSDHGSGQQVVGPRRKKANTNSIVNNIFKSAREHGAEEVGAAGPSRTDGQTSNFIFKGAGYRLGDSESGPIRPVPGTEGTLPEKEEESHVVLKLWKNGFSVDGNELRDYKDPQNAAFLNSISKGEIPMELVRQSKGGQVNLDLEDKREEEFVRPKVKVKAFSGEGNMLGSPVPNIVSTPSSAVNESSAQQGLSVDASQPVTSIQIRLADGKRLVSKFNHTHTVADVRRYIITAHAHYANQAFALLTTFPNKELTDDSQTLADAKLLNAVIVQRLK